MDPTTIPQYWQDLFPPTTAVKKPIAGLMGHLPASHDEIAALRKDIYDLKVMLIQHHNEMLRALEASIRPIF